MQTSFREKNYEEALKAALFGLDEAVDQGQEEWKQRFESMYSDLKVLYDTEIKCKTSIDSHKIGEHFKTMGQFETEPNKRDAWVPLEHEGGESGVDSEIERENSLDGDDLADVKGIGERAAGLLTKAGITTVQQLADSSIEELSRIKGIGALTAKKLLDSASVFLDSGIETDFELKDAIRSSENDAIVEQESRCIEQSEEPELVLEPFDDDLGGLQDVDDDANILIFLLKTLKHVIKVKRRTNTRSVRGVKNEQKKSSWSE